MSIDMSFDAGLEFSTGSPINQLTTGHPNPLFNYLTGFIPRKLKDLFRWSEFLSVQSAHIYAIIKKFGEYPITKLQYKSVSDGERTLRQELYEKHLNLRGFCTLVSFDKFVYGNAFVSFYRPFKRFLKCKHCRHPVAIKKVNYRFNLENLLFTYKCPECSVVTSSNAIDEKLRDPSKLRLIRWDPKLIDIDFNRISGDTRYYYTIPRSDVAAVRNNAKIMIDTMPIEWLEAMRDDRIFEFAPGEIYHLRMPGPSGVESQWGLPPIIAAIHMFLFTATLRKANEAIALEYITPFRILFPEQSSSNGDPTVSLNQSFWREQVQENYRRFRKDPLHIMLAPTPIGYKAIGGEGRTLLTIAEIQEAEKNIALSMGVPLEFIMGGLGQIRGEVTLRMIENQLQTHVDDLNGMIQWTENTTSEFFNRTPIEVALTPFKMLDDDDRKNMLFQLWTAGKLSTTTMSQSLDVDPERERKQMQEEQVAEMRSQIQTQQDISKIQNSLSAQAISQAQTAGSGGINYNDPQAALAAADQKVQEFLSMDSGTRRSQLDALESEDPVMGALVARRLEQNRQNEVQAARAQVQQAGV